MLYLSFRSSKFPLYLVAKLHPIFARIHLVFSTSLSFRLIILLFTGVLHEGSTWWFIKGLYSFSKRSSTFFSEELKLSSYCNPECSSFFHIIGGGIMSFLIILIHVSWFTCCHEWDILNPSISSLELSWVIFHLKLSLRVVAIYGAYQWPKFFIYPPGEISFSSPRSYPSNSFPVSGRVSPQKNLRYFP